MDKKTYAVPALRCFNACLERNFLTSGSGEDAKPGEGWWDDDEPLN